MSRTSADSTNGGPRHYIDNLPTRGDGLPGKECVHCRRRCGTWAGGHATIGGQSVCCKPHEANRPNCYRMIMVKFHPLKDCSECVEKN